MRKFLSLKCTLIALLPLVFASCNGAVSLNYEDANKLADQYLENLYLEDGLKFMNDYKMVQVTEDTTNNTKTTVTTIYSPTNDYYHYSDANRELTVYSDNGTMTSVDIVDGTPVISASEEDVQASIDDVYAYEQVGIFVFVFVLAIIYSFAEPDTSSSDSTDLFQINYTGDVTFTSYGEGSLISRFEGVDASEKAAIMEANFSASLPSYVYVEGQNEDVYSIASYTFSTNTTEADRAVPSLS